MAFHAQQNRRLGLSPSWLMNPWTLVGLADLYAAAIDHHSGQFNRRIRGFGRCHHGAFFVSRGPRCLFVDSDASRVFLAECLEVARRDLQPGGDADQFRRLGERAGGDSRRDHNGSNGRAIAAMIQALVRSIPGKRLADIAQNGAVPLSG